MGIQLSRESDKIRVSYKGPNNLHSLHEEQSFLGEYNEWRYDVAQDQHLDYDFGLNEPSNSSDAEQEDLQSD